MLNLTDDAFVNSIIMDEIAEGELYDIIDGEELYGEDWEDYKAHVDSFPFEESIDEMHEAMRENSPF